MAKSRPSEAAVSIADHLKFNTALRLDPTANGVGDETPSIANVPRNWDIFRLLPLKADNVGNGFWLEISLQILKLSTFFLLFAFTLFSALVAKSCFLLMAAGIGHAGRNITICADKIPESRSNEVLISTNLAAKWAWAALLCLCVPELLCFARCFHRTMFRNVKRPTILQFLVVFIVETLHGFGVGALVFGVFPNFPSSTSAMLGNAVCLVPAIFGALSRRPDRWFVVLLIIDLCAIGAQTSSYWFWPAVVPEVRSNIIAICVCVLLISFGWWQNFVSPKSFLPPVRGLAAFSTRLAEKRSKTYVVVSIWKCFIYTFCLFFFLTPTIPLHDLLQRNPFGEKLITITARDMNQTQISNFLARMHEYETPDYKVPGREEDEEEEETPKTTKHPWDPNDSDNIDAGDYETARPRAEVEQKRQESKSSGKKQKEKAKTEQIAEAKKRHRFKRSRNRRENDEDEEIVSAYNVYDDYVELNQFTTPYDALWIALIQVLSVVVCYHSSKFACKVLMQRVGFALPIFLVVPASVIFLTDACASRTSDPCFMSSILSKELFWECGTQRAHFWSWEFWFQPQTWIWIGWLLSQGWVSVHLWLPKHERLTRSEKLFVHTWGNCFFVDQSLAFNRRRDDKVKICAEDLDLEGEDSSQTYETIGVSGHPKPPPSICSVASSRLESGLIRETASAADEITKIYACATLWHESALEMTCMLKSIFRMDEDQCARRNAQKYLKVIDPDYYQFEAHILIDDAYEINDYGEPVINKYVRQFIEKVDDAASAVHKTPMRLRTPKKFATPYGGRLTYVLPGRNKMVVHLKDKNKIRHRKRWSQVMYLYYILGFQLMGKVADQHRKETITESTFILTLDGDVDFTPKCVHLLVDLMKKNRRLGAACGRIHPRGSGPMIWYQKFEYAVGHWLQKATEHMIGCVLCSPGCFSLFRASALMDDNVTRRYAMKAEAPVHYVQYDQGEDRWLCTLLLQRGYRVEYCAASDALTFAPEGFSEFFNQRRRWIPSTIANIIDLLRDYKNVVAVNESISIWYIIYQLVMLISSILGPGTIFLMIVGAISISFEIDTKVSLAIVTIPVVLFCVVCLVGTPEKQIIFAEVISAIFAMLMTAVIVGTMLQIQKDGITSPHSIFLLTVTTSFTVSAVLHPLEFTCILPAVLYFLAIPCMYMLLPIYSICNLNSFTWGTRESPTIRPDEHKTKGVRVDLVEGGLGPQAEGEISFGCGNACRLMCCLRPDLVESSPQIWRLNEGVREITKKLEQMERRHVHDEARRNSERTDADAETWPEGDEQEELDDDVDMKRQSQAAMRNRKWTSLRSEAWLNDKQLKRAERDYLDGDEEQFWVELIEEYLQPIAMDQKAQEEIRVGLTELRNKTCAVFFMVNIVFIIVVLVLQMQKDCLHIEWPLGPKFNHTIVPCNSDKKEHIWVMSRLQLEPIGLLFLVFYMSILVIQFIAMLLHRFSTLEHIIASTQLFFAKNNADQTNKPELVVQNAVEIARELQAIRGIDKVDDDEIEEKAISRRKVVRALESSRKSMSKKRTETLDAAFKRRFDNIAAMNGDADGDFGTLGMQLRDRLTLQKGPLRGLDGRQNLAFGGTIDRRAHS